MIQTLDAQRFVELLWEEGIDYEFQDDEGVCLTVCGFGTRLYLRNVWGEPGEFFMDMGDVPVYRQEGEEMVCCTLSDAETEEDLIQEVLLLLG